MPEGPEGFLLGVMRICATALFSMWDIAIIPDISPDRSAGYWTLVLCGPAGRRDAGALRDAHEIRHGSDTELLHDAAAMNFDRLLGSVQLRSDLFV